MGDNSIEYVLWALNSVDVVWYFGDDGHVVWLVEVVSRVRRVFFSYLLLS